MARKPKKVTTHWSDHPDFVALQRGVVEAPEDDAPRLVMADWLRDNGQDLVGDNLEKAVREKEQSLIYINRGLSGWKYKGFLRGLSVSRNWIGKWGPIMRGLFERNPIICVEVVGKYPSEGKEGTVWWWEDDMRGFGGRPNERNVYGPIWEEMIHIPGAYQYGDRTCAVPENQAMEYLSWAVVKFARKKFGFSDLGAVPDWEIPPIYEFVQDKRFNQVGDWNWSVFQSNFRVYG